MQVKMPSQNWNPSLSLSLFLFHPLGAKHFRITIQHVFPIEIWTHSHSLIKADLDNACWRWLLDGEIGTNFSSMSFIQKFQSRNRKTCTSTLLSSSPWMDADWRKTEILNIITHSVRGLLIQCLLFVFNMWNSGIEKKERRDKWNNILVSQYIRYRITYTVRERESECDPRLKCTTPLSVRIVSDHVSYERALISNPSIICQTHIPGHCYYR